jgi:hypothetical protein
MREASKRHGGRCLDVLNGDLVLASVRCNKDKDSFFRSGVLQVTPEPLGGGGEATHGSLSCDNTVPTEPCWQAKFCA